MKQMLFLKQKMINKNVYFYSIFELGSRPILKKKKKKKFIKYFNIFKKIFKN